MEKINITFLGTGSAIPTARRNHPAVLIKYKSENILLDCGEGTQRQFRKAKLNPCKLTRILITHWHADHVLGLPGLLQTLMLNNYNKTLHIYGPKGTKKMMQLYLALFTHKQKINIQVHEISEENLGRAITKKRAKLAKQGGREGQASPLRFLDENEFYIEAKPMKHNTPCIAYSFVIKGKTRLNKKKLEQMKIPNCPQLAEIAKGKTVTINKKKVDGKKLLYQEPQRKITYIMDTLANPSTILLAKDADLLICESTYSKDEKETAKDYFHLTSTQAADIAKKAKAKQLILMHLSQRYENPKQILTEAKKVFPKTTVAEDLDKLEI